MSNKQEKQQVESYNDLYKYMQIHPEMMEHFIKHISEDKWKGVSCKVKYDRITVHIFDGECTKPLYFDNTMCIHENGKMANYKIQETIKERMDEFIVNYFGGV